MLETPYITFQEYLDNTYSTIPVDEATFNRLSRAAEDVIDELTNSFYRFSPIEQDTPFRLRIIRKAMTQLIDYFQVTGVNSDFAAATMANGQSVTIGRTSLSNNNSSGNANGSNTKINYPSSVLNLLRQGGYLYRGVPTQCR